MNKSQVIQYFRLKFTENKSLIKTLLLEVCSKGIPFVFLPYILHAMSKEDFATFSFVSFCAIALSSVLFLGSETVVSGIYYKLKDKSTLNWNIFFLVTLTHLCFYLFLLSSYGDELLQFLFQINLTYNPKQVKLFITLASFIAGYILLFNRHFAFINKYMQFQYWNLIRLLVVNILLFYWVTYYWGEINFYNRMVVENIIGLIFILILFVWYFRKSVLKIDFDIIKNIFFIGGPMIFAYTVNLFYVVIDKFLIQEKFNKSLLASYNLSILLVYPLGLLFTTYFDVFWNPNFFKEQNLQINYSRTKLFLVKYFKIVVLFFPFFILLVFLYLFLTSNYAAYSDVVWICAVLYFVKITNFFSQFLGNFLIALNKTSILSGTNVIILLLSIGLNYFFIPFFAVKGALLSLILSEILRFSSFYFYVKKVVNPLK